jgi:hypothetical protein
LGNLGKYQDLVVAAKEVGGADKLIEKIGEGAVSMAAPRIFGKGVLVGALSTVATGVAALATKRYLDNKKAGEDRAEYAKAQLKAAVEGSPSVGNAGGESDEDTEE